MKINTYITPYTKEFTHLTHFIFIKSSEVSTLLHPLFIHTNMYVLYTNGNVNISVVM